MYIYLDSSEHVLASSSANTSSHMSLKESFAQSRTQQGSHPLPQPTTFAPLQHTLQPAGGPTASVFQPPNFHATHIQSPQFASNQPQHVQQRAQPGMPPLSSVQPPPPSSRFPPPPNSSNRFPPPQSSLVPQGVPPTLQQGPPYSQPLAPAANVLQPPPSSGPISPYGISALPHGQRPYQVRFIIWQ